MATSRETNTMSEGLQKMMRDISGLKTMPDSDLGFLQHIEDTIIGYLRPPAAPGQAEAGMGDPTGGMGGAPAAGGGMDLASLIGGGGGGPPPPVSGPPMPTGMSPGHSAINPDELNRILSQS